MCKCVCVCVRDTERGREREGEKAGEVSRRHGAIGNTVAIGKGRAKSQRIRRKTRQHKSDTQNEQQNQRCVYIFCIPGRTFSTLRPSCALNRQARVEAPRPSPSRPNVWRCGPSTLALPLIADLLVLAERCLLCVALGVCVFISCYSAALSTSKEGKRKERTAKKKHVTDLSPSCFSSSILSFSSSSFISLSLL